MKSTKILLNKAKATTNTPEELDWEKLLHDRIPKHIKLDTGTSMAVSLNTMIKYINFGQVKYNTPDLKSVKLIIDQVMGLITTDPLSYKQVDDIVKKELGILSATKTISTETASTETASTETVGTSVSISTESTASITPTIDSLKKDHNFAKFLNIRIFNIMLDKLNRDKLIFLDNYLLQFKSNKPTLNLFQLLNELIWVGEYLASGADDTIGRIMLISQKRFALRTAMRELKQIDQIGAFVKVVDFDNTTLHVTYPDLTVPDNKREVHYNMDTIIRDTGTLEAFCEHLNGLKSIVMTNCFECTHYDKKDEDNGDK